MIVVADTSPLNLSHSLAVLMFFEKSMAAF
jgi:hypothetical protein